MKELPLAWAAAVFEKVQKNREDFGVPKARKSATQDGLGFASRIPREGSRKKTQDMELG